MVKIFYFVLFLITFSSISVCYATNTRLSKNIDKKDAREMFLKGVSKLVKTGGIAAFEAPEEIDLLTEKNQKQL